MPTCDVGEAGDAGKAGVAGGRGGAIVIVALFIRVDGGRGAAGGIGSDFVIVFGGEGLVYKGRARVGAQVMEEWVGGDGGEVGGELSEGGGGGGGGKGVGVGDEGCSAFEGGKVAEGVSVASDKSGWGDGLEGGYAKAAAIGSSGRG